MPSENDVLETKKKRFRVLEAIYDLAGQNEYIAIRTSEIKNKTNIRGQELDRILEFLIKKYLIKQISPAGGRYEGEATISITHDGLCEVENAIEKPDEPTKNFPAHIYHITINGDNNLALQGHNNRTEGDTLLDKSSNSTFKNVDVEMNIKEGTGIAGKVMGDQIINPRHNLAYAASEIQQLLQILNQSYPADIPTDTQEEIEVAVKGINKNPELRERVIAALKAGTIEAVKEVTDNPYVNILFAAYEGWKNPQ